MIAKVIAPFSCVLCISWFLLSDLLRAFSLTRTAVTRHPHLVFPIFL
jgi:hypothetical protein